VKKIVRASFFKRDPITCARELIGAELIWGDCSGILVEVEAYAAVDDEAAHTFTRPSSRRFIERNQAGAAYVYFNYGVHWMLRSGERRGEWVRFDSRARATTRDRADAKTSRS